MTAQEFIVEKDGDNYTFKKATGVYDAEGIEKIRTIGVKTVESVNKIIETMQETKAKKLLEQAGVIAQIDDQIAKQQNFLSLMV